MTARYLVQALHAAFWLALAGLLALALIRGQAPTALPVLVLGGALVVWTILGLRHGSRLFALAAALLLALPVYGYEVYLTWNQPTKRGVTEALRADGVAAYPAVFPSGFVELQAETAGGSPLKLDGEEVLPLAGVPAVETVYCYDAQGQSIVYRSDDQGFRNPANDAVVGGPSIALLGGALVQGHCVERPATFDAQLDPLGRVRSFGMDGAAPLAQAAIYREYVEPTRPDRLIWFFAEGEDLSGFAEETAWPMLRAYLDPGYSQHLLDRQDAIGAGLRAMIDQDFEAPVVDYLSREAGVERSLVGELKSTLTLARLRARLPGYKERPAVAAAPVLDPPSLTALRAIWTDIVRRQQAFGGRVTFVYLPSQARFAEAADPAGYQDFERQIVTIWDELGASHVSLTPAFEARPDPAALYSWRRFTTEGYRYAGSALRQDLEQRLAVND
jgi:hypothetical protein